MALKLEDRPDSDNDNGKPSWMTNLSDFDDWEKELAEPSETDDSSSEGQPSKSKVSSPEELKDAENSAKQPSQDSSPEDELYSGDEGPTGKQRIRATLTTKRLVGGGVGALVTLGVFGALTLSSGPLQFVHIAQLLQRFHFGSMEDNGNSRLLKLYKYAKNAQEGNAANVRLGVFEKRVALSLDAKLEEIGVTKKYGGLTQQYAGVEIDPVKFSQSEVGKDIARNGDPEVVRSWLQEKYGGTVSIVEHPGGNSTFLVEPDSGFLGYSNRSLRAQNKLLLADIGEDGVVGSVEARIMGKRDAVSWHFMKKIDAKISGTLDDFITSQLKKLFQNGEDPVAATAQPKKDTQSGETTTDPASTDAATGVSDEGQRAKAATTAGEGLTNSAKEPGYISQFFDTTTGKLVGGGTAAIGLFCAIKALGDNVDSIRHDMVVLPLIRQGMLAISLGNQVMNGKDVDIKQLGVLAKQFNDPKSGSWSAAKSIQAEEGKDPTGKDIPKSASIKELQNNGFFGGVLGDIFGSSFAGFTCDAAGSFIGQAFSMTIGLVTAPALTAIGFGLAQTDIAKEAIVGLVQWLAGTPIPTLVFGPDYGNFINYGARLASNDAALSLGGVNLSDAQSTALRQYRLNTQKDDMKNQSFAERVFDPYSPDSLAGKIIDNQSTSVSTGVANMFSSIINPTKLFSSFGSIFSNRVNAAASSGYDYGFPEMGFSLDDLNNSTYEDPYANADNAISSIKGNWTKYSDRAKACFGVNLSKDGDVSTDLSAKIDPLKTTGEGAYPQDCADPSPEWTSIRFYILDTKTAEAADCYETGDSQSCTNVGFGTTSGTADTGMATSANTYFLGDSLTEGMRDAGNLAQSLQAQGWSSTIMATCGRPLAGTDTYSSCDAPPIQAYRGLGEVDQPADQAAIKSAGVVVVGLGANDPGSATFGDDVKAMVSKIKALNPNVKIYWINLYSSNSNAPAYQAMDATLNSLASTDGFTVIDWASIAGQYPLDGGVHPSGNYDKMTNLVVSKLGQAP